MGYTRVVQYGDRTEVFSYERNLHPPRYRGIRKKRAKANRFFRSERSTKRAIVAFYRLCHHNNTLADTIHFVTLTFAYDLTYKEACRYVARFMARVRKHFSTLPISYISVPELQESGRYHFHLLVYNLPSEATVCERKTRNFQRLFQRGYVDFCVATYRSAGIAGYMAKYMAKAFNDFTNEATRFYNCSRNIDKIRVHGSNTLDEYVGLLSTGQLADVVEYDVKYLGRCRLEKYQQ